MTGYRQTAAALALVALLLASAPRAFALVPALDMRMCSGGSDSTPPAKRDRRDCPEACHAACARNLRGDTDEDCCD